MRWIWTHRQKRLSHWVMKIFCGTLDTRYVESLYTDDPYLWTEEIRFDNHRYRYIENPHGAILLLSQRTEANSLKLRTPEENLSIHRCALCLCLWICNMLRICLSLVHWHSIYRKEKISLLSQKKFLCSIWKHNLNGSIDIGFIDFPRVFQKGSLFGFEKLT